MKRTLSIIAALTMALGVEAMDFSMEPMKLEVPEMNAELTRSISEPLSYDFMLDNSDTQVEQDRSVMFSSERDFFATPEPKTDFDFFKSKTNQGVKPYKFMDDMTFVGVPIFVAGIIAKNEKRAFRQDYNNSHANTRLITNFKTSIDDYTQFFGPAMTVGLKVGGVEGRSDWPRLFASAAMSYGIMAAFVNGIKYTAKEMRPDGSTANSWPSGHTATSFVGATILHKEYGLTRSPWYSVAGYGVATATGIMRVLNNRHWVSDVLSGAGIGIFSGELAYALSDVLFKDKGLLRGDLEGLTSSANHPSFFSISMGIGLGNKTLDFESLDEETNSPIKLDFQTSTVVGVEGAYFINKFVGLGGRLRVRTSPIKGWENFMQMAKNDANEIYSDLSEIGSLTGNIPGSNPDELKNILIDKEFTIESDHITEFAADAGLYFNVPITSRLSIGTKLLVGRSIMQELDLNARYAGKVKDLQYDMTIVNGTPMTLDINSIATAVDDNGKELSYEDEWDYLTVSANNSTKWGTGLSLTYAYKHNFSFKLFCDYDFTKKTYTLTYDPDHYIYKAMPGIVSLASIAMGETPEATKRTLKKNMNTFVIGAAFSVSF